MIKKIKLGTSLAALVLFFLPWLEIQCSEKSLATQTGIQVVSGDGTSSEEMKSGGTRADQSSDSESSVGKAPLIGVALLAVVGAVFCSFVSLFKGGKSAEALSSIFPAVALVFLLIQLLLGFPVENELAESMSEKSEQANEGELGAFGSSIAKGVMMNVKVERTPAFYLELLALGIPTLLLVNSMIDRYKKSENEDAL